MRYSPYVTYGHQGLTLGQHPAQPLSGTFWFFNSSQHNRCFAKGNLPLNTKMTWIKVSPSTDTSCGDYAVPLAPAHYSDDTDSDLERTEDYVFLQVEIKHTDLVKGLTNPKSACLIIQSLFLGARSGDSTRKPRQWAGSSNWGRCCSTQHPLIPGTNNKIHLAQIPS